MTTLIRRAPLFVQDRGSGDTRMRGHVGALVWHSDRPEIVTIVLAAVAVDVTLNGFTAGLFDEYPEPSGGISMWPHFDAADSEWLVVDVENADADVQVTIDPDRAFEFLADVAIAACVGGVRLPEPVDVAEDLPFRPLRSEGGPL